MILRNFDFELSERTKKILFGIVIVAMAMPAASEYMNNVVDTNVDCNATYKGKIVHIEQARYAPAPTNKTFFYSSESGWMKETDITDKTCKELKK
ncbi:hypothetical protein Aeh1ORF263c [Aeromonas phage Aeh1]|uniref:Uncharacterized protein n=1 Tax=Aeromonas phage Aeh1 TaxID=2880362 RepID=Q76YG8_9CAUD|nr:hypothetical protein Aeh1p277 [Aeromonas phage Aeh1]AAQ17927.1 hypothetical protein Aeh1ORF263c [Aeromonas phage Aeh1]